MEKVVGTAGEEVCGEAAAEEGEVERIVADGGVSEGGSRETVGLLVLRNARVARDVDERNSGKLGCAAVGRGVGEGAEAVRVGR